LAVLRPLIGASGEAAADLAFEHWGFARKIDQWLRPVEEADAAAAAGAKAAGPSAGPRRLGEISRAALRRGGQGTADAAPTDAAAPEGVALAAAFVEGNYTRDDFRSLIGANVFNDVTWFNKEAFEGALLHGKLLALLDGAEDLAESAERIGGASEALEKAKDASGYKLGGLLRALSGEVDPAASQGDADPVCADNPVPRTADAPSKEASGSGAKSGGAKSGGAKSGGGKAKPRKGKGK
jgi:hypothetical protein